MLISTVDSCDIIIHTIRALMTDEDKCSIFIRMNILPSSPAVCTNSLGPRVRTNSAECSYPDFLAVKFIKVSSPQI